MAYQRIYTGQNIEDGVSVNTTQNDRLIDLENKINTLYGKIIPIFQDKRGVVTID